MRGISCVRNLYAFLGDILAHVSISLDILYPVVVHDTEIAGTEGIRHSQRNLPLGLDNLCPGLLCLGLHLLLESHGHRTALLSTGLSDILVGIGLVDLQHRTDILAYVDISDINRKNLESRTSIEALGQHHLGNRIRVLQHILVRLRRTDTGHDTLTYAGENGLLTCTADELDALGRVLDFQVVKERLCQWLEDHWDHRFLVWDKDPLLEGLRALDPSVSVLPCNPSAENMARYLGEVVGPAQLEGTGARLVAVEVEETAKCKARWSL